jgi:D-alanyl-lipoteichoic acid acyltransferase DltB (MBOAT superfamily)
MGTLVLVGDLVYLILCKDVGALWDPLGALVYGLYAKEHAVGPYWHLAVGAVVTGGALWLGFAKGAAIAARQRELAWGALAGVVGLGAAVFVTRETGDLAAMSAGWEEYGHLFFIAIFGVAVGASQTDEGRPFGRVVVLLVASSVFYHAWASVQSGAYRYLLLVLLAIIVGDFLLGLAIEKTENRAARKALLFVSLASNLGVLGLFKYADFFRLDVLQLGGEPLNLLLPAGISFHTFQSLSYTIDVYRKQIPACRSVVQFATFVLFFPQLVAGPIVRAHQLLPQMDRLPPLDGRLAADGLFRIVVGLFKKIALADLLARVIVDRVFENPQHFSGLEVVLGVCAYAFQIYLDFSAYSDIAIGSAQLLGFKFPENFRTPYRSANLQEFWRRWHITLSTWLRDYLYIPLGGGRGSAWATYRNLIVTMLLGGLWHGASWTYVTWGALHGFGLAVTRMFQRGSQWMWWMLGALGVAVVGLVLHVGVVAERGEHGAVFHLIVGWMYLAPLWAAITVWLTSDPVPVPSPDPGAATATATAPATSTATTSAVVPAPSRVERRQHPRPATKPATPPKATHQKGKKKRGKKRRERGAIQVPTARVIAPAAQRAVPWMRWGAMAIGVGALVWFIAWAAAPVWFARQLPGLVVEEEVVSAVPPPAMVLWVAVVAWAIALVADAIEARPDAAAARRWLITSAKRSVAIVLTFTYVCLAWIFFRAPSFAKAEAVLEQIATLSTDTGSLLPQVPIVLGVAAMAHFFAPRTFAWMRDGFVRIAPWWKALVLVAAALCLSVLAASKAQAFIYFQF